MYEHNHQKPEWITLGTVQVIQHSRITLLEDAIVLPSGKNTRYLRFGKTSEAALVILQDEEGRILLETEYSYPPDKVLYQFPCGVFSLKEESPLDAAQRELCEEAGLSAKLTLIGSYLMYHRRTDATMYVFSGTNPEEDKSGKPDITEDIKLHWLMPEEIDTLIANGQIINVDVLAPWLLYKQLVLLS